MGIIVHGYTQQIQPLYIHADFLSGDCFTEHIKEKFEEYFKRWSITLPEDTGDQKRGRIRKEGWDIRYIFDEENKIKFLEFYASGNMTGDMHARIYEDGRVETLDAIQDYITYNPGIPGDRERRETDYLGHNQKIFTELYKKGLI